MDRAHPWSCSAMEIGMLRAGTVGDVDDDACTAIDVLIPADSAPVTVTHRNEGGCERTVVLRPPMVAVVPTGDGHRLRGESRGATLVLRIDGAFIAEQARELGDEGRAEIVPCYAAFDPFIRELGNALQREIDQHADLPADYLQSLAKLMAVHLARCYGGPTSAMPAGLPLYKLKRIETYVEEHLSEKIHVEQLACEVNLSPFHFARMFKKTTGQSPHLYVVMRRVERAKQLLRDTELQLVELAADVGFCTQGHFTGVFHRYTGITPRAFRLRCRAAQAA
jgi:AraC family transcriptional regulator